MAQLGYTVNANELPEDNGGSFDPIPAGEYTVRITEAGVQQTQAGTGEYIKLRMDVTGPSHEGRVLFANLNIKNPSQKAEEIGRQQLGAVMRAINLTAINDTDQLIGGDLKVKVAIRQSEQYGPQNEVKSFKAVGGSATPMPSAPAPAATAPSAAAASGKPPWAK